MRKRVKKILAFILAVGIVAPSQAGIVEPVSMVSTVEAATNKLTLNVSNKNIYVGASAKLNVKATKGAKVTYKSSNSGVVTVNSKGIIKGKKAGTAKITVTASKAKYKTVKKIITVEVIKRDQKITASNVSIYYKGGRYLGAKAKTGLTYKSSNSSVVSVNSRGYVTGKKVGTAKIYITAKVTGTYNKATKTVTVKVIKKPSVPVKPTATPRPTAKPTATPKPTAKPTATPKPTAAPKPTATPKPTAAPKPTATPKPTAAPKPTATPAPTATPTPIPVVEPSDAQKAEIDTLCGKDYRLPYFYTKKDMCSASSFKFTADKSLARKGGYCYVESADLTLVRVYPSEDSDSVLWMDAVDLVNDTKGKKVKVTFTMGSYTKSCYVELVGTDADWDTVPEEDIAKAIVDRSDLADEVVRLINEYRVSKGLNALQVEERTRLREASVVSGISILNACKNSCPNVVNTLASHGVSEIGWGSTGPCYNPKEVVEDWINSPLHNSNILGKKLNTIACAYFIGGYEYPVTGHVYAYTSVKVSLSNATVEDLDSYSDDLSDECILAKIEGYVNSKEELHKYASWFYHPKGTSVSTQSLVPDDFSDSPVVDFSDGISDSTEDFTSEQVDSDQNDLEISEVEDSNVDVNSDDTSSDSSKQATE